MPLEFEKNLSIFTRIKCIFTIMLYRNLLYTGVTRAKELCGVIGHPKAMGIAIRNVKPVNRNTGLARTLIEKWGARRKEEMAG